MAIKPKSRKHEDRLCKLEVDLANLRDSYELNRKNVITELWRLDNRPTFWQKLNDYLRR